MARICSKCGKHLSTNEIEKIAMEAAMRYEVDHGRTPEDVSRRRVGITRRRLGRGRRGVGYDLKSVGRSEQRVIEVKGHAHYERTANLTESEVEAFNNPQIRPLFWIYYVDHCHTGSPKVQPFYVRREVQLGRLSLSA